MISFIGESHTKAAGYSTKEVIDRIVSMKPSRVIVAIDINSTGHSGAYLDELKEITGNPEIEGSIVFANVDESSYLEQRKILLEEFSKSAENVVKKNIFEMIYTTVRSYLEGYWKDYDTVNSEVTDSLFRATHKLMSTMFWEVERDTWNRMMEETVEKIRDVKPGPSDVILVDVEKKYWLADNLDGNYH